MPAFAGMTNYETVSWAGGKERGGEIIPVKN
jgi:hypothetical protein